MAIPVGTKIWEEKMDPYDIADYQVNCATMLVDNERVASYSLTIPVESQLFGLTIKDSGDYHTTLVDGKITMWLGIDPDHQEDVSFNNKGVLLPISVNIITSSTPPRRRQRSVAVRVVQR